MTVATTNGRVSDLLVVEDLRKVYSSRRRQRRGSEDTPADADTVAVDGVSFEVGAGETLAIVGQSGSGKSTVARCVTRLLPVTSGRILFAGSDITQLRGRGLRRLSLEMQIVFQDPKQSFNPRLRLKRSLNEPLKIHGLPSQPAITEVLEMVGLAPSYLRRYPHELSGGELQRLAIARALLVKPRLIVLDEPVSALDVSVQAQITSLLRELQGLTGVGYLFIAHDLAVVRELAHRVAVMRYGRVLEMKKAPELFAQPEHPYTRDLIAASEVPRPAQPTRDHGGQADG